MKIDKNSKGYRIGYAIGDVIGTIATIALIAYALSVVLTWLSGCNIPDVSEIEAAECTDVCIAVRKICVAGVQIDSHVCTDVVCAVTAAERVEGCWSDCVDCLALCLHEVQDTLKGAE